jgi:hypothetical protein
LPECRPSASAATRRLYDRRETPSQAGRVLTEEDIAHYQRVVVALKETMRLMEEIDEVKAHSGWPIE